VRDVDDDGVAGLHGVSDGAKDLPDFVGGAAVGDVDGADVGPTERFEVGP